MNITIEDLMKLDYFKGMRLIAGRNGLSRTIADCGILDYEFDQSLKGKYLYSNFHENQFALTTFLYAKNNPFLIGEAVKYLVGKNACALAIKNVFNLSIHESVLRYAESKNFPIFLIEDDKMYFEQIIVNIADFVKDLTQADFCEQETNALLYQSFTSCAIKNAAYRINPSFMPQHLAVFLNSKTPMSIELYNTCRKHFEKSPLHSIHNSYYRFRNGIMFIFSCDMLNSDTLDEQIPSWLNCLVPNTSQFSIGTSCPHFLLEEFNQTLQESIYAAAFFDEKNGLYKKHSDLGLYRVILPLLEEGSLHKFSAAILEPLREFDAENKGNLFDTVIQLVECDGNLHVLSDKMEQHENTLRARFEKIALLTGLNYRKPNHYEQLSMAAKVYLASKKIIL